MTSTRTAGKVETFAHAVAAQLSALGTANITWTAYEDEDRWYVRPAGCPSADGLELDTYNAARLHFRREWNDLGRVAVDGQGSLYALRHFDSERRDYVGESVYLTDEELKAVKAVTSALDADPERFAKRVAKYVDRWLPILRDRVQRQRQAEANLVSNEQTADRLVKKLGGYTRGVDHRGATVYPGVQEIRRIEVRGDQTEIELRIPTAQLEEILTALGYEA